MTKATLPTAPRPEIVAYMVARGWRNLGLGRFRNARGDVGRIVDYGDDRPGMMLEHYCAIQGPRKSEV